MQNNLETAVNRPKKGPVSKLRNQLQKNPAHSGGGAGFADQYFSSLLAALGRKNEDCAGIELVKESRVSFQDSRRSPSTALGLLRRVLQIS